MKRRMESMAKVNCWESKKCGRILGGEHAKDLGICPAYKEARLDTVHGGRNAGRACWVVAGTLCGGAEQGTFAKKYHNCEKCDFYQTVKNEEGAHFQLSVLLLSKIKRSEEHTS